MKQQAKYHINPCFLSVARTTYSTLREKQSNDSDVFDFYKHLNTVMVEIHQLCSLRAPECDTLLSSGSGRSFL